MSDLHRDPELRERFAELQRVQARHTPAFGDVLEHARQQAARESSEPRRKSLFTGKQRLLWGGGLAAAAVIATLIVFPRGPSGEDQFEQAVQAFSSNPALGSWR